MKNKLSAIIMAILIMMTPLVYAEPDTNEEFTLTAFVPSKTKDDSIVITGTTKANIDVIIILNKARVAELKSDSDGNFETEPIILLREDNEIVIRATDSSGNLRTLNYNVKMDMTPPTITYSTIPEGSTTRTLQVSGTSTEPVTIKYRTSNLTQYKTVQVNESFTFSIDLEDGLNKLELISEDAAGNTDKQEFDIVYDIVSPQFQSTNLDKLEPCYFDWPAGIGKKVDIKGQLNEKATIFVYVNKESTPSKVRTTDDTGYFRIKDVQLTTKVKTTVTPTSATLEIGESYPNHIKITAKDLAGNQASIEKTITCSTCGGGASGFTMNTAEALQAATPAILLPKLLIQGQEMVTIPFNLTYTGLNTARIRNIRISTAQLAEEYAEDYDNDKITAFPITQLSRDRQSATGIIQIKINKFDPLGDTEPDASNYRREYDVSKHRYGKCTFRTGLYDVEYGCMRFFLLLEINYNENIAQVGTLDPNIQQTRGPTIERKTQKICISHIELPIDRIVDDFTPKKMVKKIRKNIDHALKKIEPVKDVIDDISEYTLYTCIGALGTVTLTKLAEISTCTIGEWISLAGDAPWHSEIAETGLCDEVYHSDYDEKGKGEEKTGINGNERARKSCNSCRSVLVLRKWMQYEVMNRVCDRIACPAAKTFKKYIEERRGSAQEFTKQVTDYLAKVQKQGNINTEAKITELKQKYGVNGKLYTGNDCGFGTEFIKPEYGTATETPPHGIKSLYMYAKRQINRDYCIKYGRDEPRTAKPQCCGVDYEREWGSSCGVGRIFGTNIGITPLGIPIGLDTFDELKESTCFAARQAGRPDDTLAGGTTCGGLNLWNAAAGFCEPNTGAARSEPIYTGMFYDPAKEDSEDNRVYMFVTPKTDASKGVINYQVFRGYVIKRVKYKADTKEYSGKSRELTQALYEVYYPAEDLSGFFKGEESAEKQKKKFVDKLKTYKDIRGYTPARAESTYDRIESVIGAPDKEYIVRPDSGLLRAIQCICLPAVKAWIDEWTKILTLLRDCIATVEIGKGDAGICDQFIAQAICDRIYDLLKCFSSKLSAPGAGFRVSEGAGIGNIIGLLTNTASEMSNIVESRYGKTGIWNSLFNEKQLIHGICLWAFTGKWDLEISQIMQHTIEEMPIESQPFIGECKRYFRGYNPNTNPAGLANWVYECGAAIIAGADINYQIKLQCSDDLRCKIEDGFRNNECDCIKGGKRYHILEQGTLKRGDIFNKRIIKAIQATQSGADVRYDTAILYYEWLDPKTNTKRSNSESLTQRYISQGEAPFGFCAFDPFTAKFRCQFGKQESGIKIEEINMDYQYKHKDKGTKAFVAEQPETFKFKFTVKQQIPDTPQEQKAAKKYLFFKMKNHVNNLVAEAIPTEDNPIATFESNGDYTKTVKIFENEDYGAELVAKLNDKTGEQIRAWISRPNQVKKQTEGSRYISEYTVKRESPGKDDKTVTDSPPILAELAYNKVEFYNVRSVGYSTATKGTKITEADIPNPGPYQASGTIGTKEYIIEVTIEKLPEADETITIHLPPGREDLPSPYSTGNPASWTVEFTLYDANEYGEVSKQISISPDGREQRQAKTFKVIKQDVAIEISPEEPVAAPVPAPLPGQVYIPSPRDPEDYEIRSFDIVLSDYTGNKKFYLVTRIQNNQIVLTEVADERGVIMPVNDIKDNTVKLIKNDIWKVQETPRPGKTKALVAKLPALSRPLPHPSTEVILLEGDNINKKVNISQDKFDLESKLAELKQRGITTKFISDSPSKEITNLAPEKYYVKANDYVMTPKNIILKISEIKDNEIKVYNINSGKYISEPVNNLKNMIKVVHEDIWLTKGNKETPTGHFTSPEGELVQIKTDKTLPAAIAGERAIITVKFLAKGPRQGAIEPIQSDLLHFTAKKQALEKQGIETKLAK